MSTPLTLGTCIQLISQAEIQIQIQTQTAIPYANSETRDFHPTSKVKTNFTSSYSDSDLVDRPSQLLCISDIYLFQQANTIQTQTQTSTSVPL